MVKEWGAGVQPTDFANTFRLERTQWMTQRSHLNADLTGFRVPYHFETVWGALQIEPFLSLEQGNAYRHKPDK
jgi:hypothetical protein